MIALDANVLIALQDASHPLHQPANQLISEAIANDEDLMISELTLAETLVHRVIRGEATQFLNDLAALGVKPQPINPGDGLALAKLRAKHSTLRMPDAVVLHLALRLDALATFDKRLAATAQTAGVSRILGLPQS
ncbi:MAG: PIN domain-containing protein [Bifidobacteriaceae bacterium]|jgi:predicted nucleic acid-binding protein|nr:PIN domain-containing protein [Bifidobacteriaceae bacterium]